MQVVGEAYTLANGEAPAKLTVRIGAPGRSTSDLIAGYYPLRTGSKGLSNPVQIIPLQTSIPMDVQIGVAGTLQPYDEQRGWPASGRSWLVVEVFLAPHLLYSAVGIDVGKSTSGSRCGSQDRRQCQ